MNKFFLTAVAAGALAAGATAFAQENVIPSSMYDMGIPPAAQTNPEGGRITTDAYGRSVIVDRSGREIVPGVIVGYDAWGRAVYADGAYGNYAFTRRSAWDRDGDGIPNRRDRYPDDPRYR